MAAAARLDEVIGKVKRIGPYGPMYEVRKILGRQNNGDYLLQIELPESGEIVDYPLSDFERDPEAE